MRVRAFASYGEKIMRTRITRFVRCCVSGAFPLFLMIKPLVPSTSALAIVAAHAVAAATPVASAENLGKHFEIAAGDAAITLKRFAEDSGNQVVFLVDSVRGITTNPLKGEYTPREALSLLVANTVLVVGEDAETGALMARRTNESKKPIAPIESGSSEKNSTSVKRRNSVAVLSGWLALILGTAPALTAADGTPAGPGAIEGRVLNVTNGEYVEKARVTVEGTTLEAFTQSDGTYRLPRVQAGSVQLRTFYTGLSQQTDVVNVSAGQTVQHDIVLSGFQRKADSRDEVVKLDLMVVSTSKQMDGAAIAINEQRFAPNFKNVLASDEFGVVPEGNVGEFLKFLPGVTMDYGGGDARTIAINGAPSNYVPVTIGGFDLASAASSGTGRSVELEGVSINNISRLEVYYTPTPESPGSALAGGVNLVPRSAFDRAKPVFNYSAFLMMRDDARDFRKTPGPLREPTRKVHPGFDFSYVAPVSKTFGFTLTGAHSQQFNNAPVSQMTWRGVGGGDQWNDAPRHDAGQSLSHRLHGAGRNQDHVARFRRPDDRLPPNRAGPVVVFIPICLLLFRAQQPHPELSGQPSQPGQLGPQAHDRLRRRGRGAHLAGSAGKIGHDLYAHAHLSAQRSDLEGRGGRRIFAREQPLRGHWKGLLQQCDGPPDRSHGVV